MAAAGGRPGGAGDRNGDDRECVDPLEVLLTATTGTVRDLPGEKQQAAKVRASHRSQAQELLEGASVPKPVAALAVQRRWLGDNEGAVELAALVARLVARLVTLRASGVTQLLAEAAQQLYGNPHALDRDQALGRAAVRVLAASQAFAAGVDPDDLVVASDGALVAARCREVWEAAGVQCDRVSATVLVLNVTLTGERPAAALSSVLGEPVWLTARSLSGVWAPTPGLDVVRVCENPSVIEVAADELGSACPPLVCTYGRPSTAAHMLLRGLQAAGTRLLVSADRDVAGKQIGAELLATYPGAEPWCPDLVGMFEEERLRGLLADLKAT